MPPNATSRLVSSSPSHTATHLAMDKSRVMAIKEGTITRCSGLVADTMPGHSLDNLPLGSTKALSRGQMDPRTGKGIRGSTSSSSTRAIKRADNNGGTAISPVNRRTAINLVGSGMAARPLAIIKRSSSMAINLVVTSSSTSSMATSTRDRLAIKRVAGDAGAMEVEGVEEEGT